MKSHHHNVDQCGSLHRHRCTKVDDKNDITTKKQIVRKEFRHQLQEYHKVHQRSVVAKEDKTKFKEFIQSLQTEMEEVRQHRNRRIMYPFSLMIRHENIQQRTRQEEGEVETKNGWFRFCFDVVLFLIFLYSLMHINNGSQKCHC